MSRKLILGCFICIQKKQKLIIYELNTYVIFDYYIIYLPINTSSSHNYIFNNVTQINFALLYFDRKMKVSDIYTI